MISGSETTWSVGDSRMHPFKGSFSHWRGNNVVIVTWVGLAVKAAHLLVIIMTMISAVNIWTLILGPCSDSPILN